MSYDQNSDATLLNSFLDKDPTKIRRPPPIPAGTFKSTILGVSYKVSTEEEIQSRPKAPRFRMIFRLNPHTPQADVNPDDLKANGYDSESAKAAVATFELTAFELPKDEWRFKAIAEGLLGEQVDRISPRDWPDALVGKEVFAKFVIESWTKNGEQKSMSKVKEITSAV